MHPDTGLLLPRPRTALQTDQVFELPERLDVSLSAPDEARLRSLRQLTAIFSRHSSRPVDITLDDRPDSLVSLRVASGTPESYRLSIETDRIEIVGGDEAGLFYGLCTLDQWVRLHERSSSHILGLRIDDGPDFRHRGVMLDVSRDKVPTLETLYELIDLLASWKINQLQLYFEHTFAYRGHEVVWQGCDPLTPVDIHLLDRFCSNRYIELIPNQNSFGHFHRWLVHEPYRSLAEVPEGIEHPFSDQKEPFGLCPTDPRCLDLLTDLYDQLLPHFRSRRFTTGLDETIDIGMGRSKEAVEASSTEAVYLDYLLDVDKLVSARDHQMLFFADIIHDHPHLVSQLPKNAVALEWGYESDHPFTKNLEPFSKAQLEFWVCPGTSSWNSFGGRTENAIGNLAAAATQGHRAGAAGYVITDWGDFGHLQPLSISYLPVLAGAGFSWNVASAISPDPQALVDILDIYVFEDETREAGQAVFDLGQIYQHTSEGVTNASALFLSLLWPDRSLEHPRLKGLTAPALNRSLADLEAVLEGLARSRMKVPSADLIVTEIEWTVGMLQFACRFSQARVDASGAGPSELPPEVRQSLSTELKNRLKEHREIWLARNRPGGLDDSQRRLRRLQASLGA